MTTSLWSGFLGTWALIPESCQYDQGAPPLDGTYTISVRDDGALNFDMTWTDDGGTSHTASFAGKPDGRPAPYDGGDLADALSVTAVSDRELNTSAFKDGRERMVAQRQLDASRDAMRVVQVVRLRDGTSPTNVSIYRRVH